MSLHLKLLDIDQPLTFEGSKLRQIEAHALIYLSASHDTKLPPYYNVKPSSLYDILCLSNQRTPLVYHCKATFGNVGLCLKLIRRF